ncbi:sensor histidine kinase [Puerhibacterium puerhi]|uniref:sensor histidine kinase n=1 Tax=Puerhibacterium puerhi TaxID=2692623 RepID=UPI001F18A07D|nr:histidine kinase [Puerhibacterium puerhi]
MSDADLVPTPTQVQRAGPVRRWAAAHPWATDAAPAAVVLLLGLVTVTLAWQTVQGSTNLGMYSPGASAAWAVPTAWSVGAVLGAALVAARRRWPLGVTGALTVLAVASLGTAAVLGVLGVCLACALHAVAAARPARATWLTAAAVFAVLVVAQWAWQDIGLAEILLWADAPVSSAGGPPRALTEPPFSSGRRSASVSLLLALLLLGVATGSAARARRRHALDLVERYAALARERDQSAALARAAERARIAREMHDVVAHSVSVMVALSDGAAAALDRAPDRSRDALRHLSRTGREALTDMQRVLGALDPREAGAGERPEPAVTDLAVVVDRFRAAGVPVSASGLEVPLPADTSLRLAVARVVTEALTNVLRHAPGTTGAHVGVRRDARQIEVEVLDDGGTRPSAGGGTGRGVLGMRERAAVLGGRVEAGPRAGGGWRVHVVLPWDGSGEGRAERRVEDEDADEDEGGCV